ncbi:response regulator transcription factor [Amaricoccus solimangrovi]|uniref:Response regulator transcription factor n=1 Tax=Amaricoccus solimangrovi TaxID=2589815 RepID=A0A501WIE4_9RHOB|nr:response regulator transcription factor [Amaricoccus solimangrovi]TPE49148.1 response regulator transcription factor [Amaricoccus solimangrovi]
MPNELVLGQKAVVNVCLFTSKAQCMRDQTRDSEDDRGERPFRNTIAFIDAAPLARECFTRIVESEHPRIRVAAFGSVEEWRLAGRDIRFDVVTCSVGTEGLATVTVGRALRDLVAQASPTPVIALADTDSVEMMTAAVNCGARGCIPTRIGVDALIHAVRLISSGCVTLPATAFAGMRREGASILAAAAAESSAPLERDPDQRGASQRGLDLPERGCDASFTPRQRMVAEALRQGKANKVIARELDICENTVKVHVRVIMRKLGARNRTEVAFIMNRVGYDRETGARPS